MRVLIVDDSKTMRMMVSRAVRQAGLDDATFDQAEDAPSAYESIVASKPDLVLCDWNMPGMTGIELLRKLRAEGHAVAFGFVTSESTAAMRDAAAEAGAAFLVSKPFTADSFRPVLVGIK